MRETPKDVSKRRSPLRFTRLGKRALAVSGLLLLLFVVLLLLGSMSMLDWGLGTMADNASTGSGEKIEVTIPEGMSAADVASLLENEGVIESSQILRLRIKAEGLDTKLKSGRYAFAPGESSDSILEKLTRGGEEEVSKILIPEGLSMDQTAAWLSSEGVLDGKDYLSLSQDLGRFSPPRLGGASPEVDNLEGFLFPSTYTLPRESGAAELIRLQLEAFVRQTASLPWHQASDLGVDPLDVLIVASIIEKEVRVPEERAKVAAVIYNRIEKQMPLGVDATVRFALKKWTGPLTKSDLAVDSPYNTRLYEGMPPGPISSPGLAAIRAALDPADVDYLYYVLIDDEGHHRFTSSYEEFLKAKEAAAR